MTDGCFLGAGAVAMNEHGKEPVHAVKRKNAVDGRALEGTKCAACVAEIHFQHAVPRGASDPG